MVDSIPIDDNSGLSPIKPTPAESSPNDEAQEGDGFQHLVNQTGANRNPSKPSPLSMAQNSQSSIKGSKPSAESFVANVNQMLGQMQNLKGNLQTPNLKLNPRTRRLLDAKLKRTKDHINFISSKVNVGDEGNQEKPQDNNKTQKVGSSDENKSHIDKFINYITDGQAQLESVMHKVSHLKKDKNKPGVMLQDIFGMQVKLYRAQTEIEFSTAVLQKGIDDLKTIMSVQL